MKQCSLLWVFALLLLHLQYHRVSCATVDGCDGHLCSTANNTVDLFGREQNAVLFSRCHAACSELIATESQLQMVRESNTAWPTRPLEILSHNCIELRKLMECRRGCIIKNSNLPKCRSVCRSSCQSECPNGASCQYNNTGCQIGCSNEDCRSGCVTILPSAEGQRPPNAPLAPPALRENATYLPRPAGIYRIDSYPTPTHDGSVQVGISGFLFKVEVGSTIQFFYQTSITDEDLDLSSFACQNVRVSFAVVTKYTISQFSPTRNVCVYGGTRYPSQLSTSDITYTLAPDDRQGYRQNAVLNISWNKPRESHLITNYTLTLFTNDSACTTHASEIERYSGISGDASSFVVKALAPERIPRIKCLYQYTIQVHPNNTANFAYGVIDIRDPARVLPDLMLECSASIDGSTGLISASASWSLERPSQHQRTEGDMYIVTYTRVNWSPGLQMDLLPFTSVNVTAHQNGSASHTETRLTPNTAVEARIKITVTPILPPSTDSSFQYTPTRKECLLRALPHTPGVINSTSIELLAFKVDELGSIRMNLSWEEPEKPYGTIENYQVRLLRENVKTGNEITASVVIAETHINMNVRPGDIIFQLKAGVDILPPCLYVQVRAKNNYYWGEWSALSPLLLEPEKHTSCNFVIQEGVRDPSSGSPLPIAAWIGIGVAACAVLVLCLLCTCLCICICRRHRMKVQMKRAFENGYSNPMFAVGGRALQRRNSSLRVPLTLTHGSVELDDWEIPVKSVIVDTKFGEGCFGEVHRGVVRGPLPSTRTMKSNICVTVAIKMLKASATGSERTDFLHEIDTMKRIAEGNNPHVSTFIGCVTIQEPLCLITEFVKYGDLLSYLETIRKLVTHKNRRKKFARMSALKEPEPYLEPRMQKHLEQAAAQMQRPNSFLEGGVARGDGETGVVPSPDSPYAALGEVDPVNLISFAYQIATGMEYLSSLDIVHRDLACRNILIGENKNLKISDFGMSRVVTGDDIYVKTTKGRLPWKWMAIESIVNREFTHASDIWSYGVTLWEIATLGGFPYPMISNAELLEHLKRGFRLECPDNCSPEIYKVMMECWDKDPNERKTFPEIRSLFDAMLAENNPYIQFENINSHKPYYNTTQQAQSETETASSQRNSRSEDENIVGLSESEIDFEASSTSTSTLNIPSVVSAYDYLRPVIPNVEVTAATDEHSLALQMANPYVETPTFKFLMNQDSFELSHFELDLEHIQQSDEMESSTEVQVEINSSANSATADE